MKGSESVFGNAQLVYYKCCKINPNRDGPYDSPDWIKNQKATINHINKKHNICFQYAVTVALNDEKIKKDPEKTTKIKPFIDKYNCKDDWEKFEKNNVTIVLNVLYAKKKNCPAYVSKHNSNLEKQIILLMIPNREGWHYLAVKKLPALLRGIT